MSDVSDVGYLSFLREDVRCALVRILRVGANVAFDLRSARACSAFMWARDVVDRIGDPPEFKRGRDMDPEVEELCHALNQIPGIRTTESCSGHGVDPLFIWFHADNLPSLYVISRAISRRYGGNAAWRAELSDSDSGTDFLLTSGDERGYVAYTSADRIARNVLDLLLDDRFRKMYGIDGADAKHRSESAAT